MRKGKINLSPLPWKFGEVFVKHISHLHEYAVEFD
jgi:hypothetical protein